MENNEFKNAYIKNSMCYYFYDVTKFENFDFDILINENHTKIFKFVTFHIKL